MVESMDGMNDYGMVIEVLAGRLAATVASIQRMVCRHCRVAVIGDIRFKTEEVVLDAAKAHHSTCTARPLEVGDYVRWHNGDHYLYAEGVAVDIVQDERGRVWYVTIDVLECSDGFHDVQVKPRPGKQHKFGVGDRLTVRRVPRPDVTVRTQVGDIDRQRRQTRARLDKLGILKHGPMQSGDAGPCDPDCRKCAAEAAARDPLDVEHDGVKLRVLLECDARRRSEIGNSRHITFTPAQRAAVSAHWSAALRAKVQASREADKARQLSVVVDMEVD